MSTENELNKMAEIAKNGWNEWAKYVLLSLEELKKQHSESEIKDDKLQLLVIKEISDLRGEIKVINNRITQRATAISLLAGGLPALATLIFWVLKMKG